MAPEAKMSETMMGKVESFILVSYSVKGPRITEHYDQVLFAIVLDD